MKTNIKIRISVSLIVVAFGITAITLEARTSDSLFFRNASACSSVKYCDYGWESGTIGGTTYCCLMYTGHTGFKEGVRPPRDEEQ